MSMVIGSVTLDNDMVWTDRYQYSPIVATVDRALSGREIIQLATRPTGQPITLEGSQEHGWQSRETVQELIALASSYTTFTFTIGNESAIAVRFRYDGETSPVSFQPISLFQPQTGLIEWWYYGTILLATI